MLPLGDRLYEIHLEIDEETHLTLSVHVIPFRNLFIIYLSLDVLTDCIFPFQGKSLLMCIPSPLPVSIMLIKIGLKGLVFPAIMPAACTPILMANSPTFGPMSTTSPAAYTPSATERNSSTFKKDPSGYGGSEGGKTCSALS